MNNISHPGRIWRTWIKLPLQPVRNDNASLPTSMPWPLMPNLGPKLSRMHRYIDPGLATMLTIFSQVAKKFPITIDSATFQPELLNQACEPFISDGALGLRVLSPSVITTGVKV